VVVAGARACLVDRRRPVVCPAPVPKAMGALGLVSLFMLTSSQLHAWALERDDAVIMAR